MMIDMLIEGIRMVVILVSFFTLSGQRFFEQERKQSIAIIVLIWYTLTIPIKEAMPPKEQEA